MVEDPSSLAAVGVETLVDELDDQIGARPCNNAPVKSLHGTRLKCDLAKMAEQNLNADLEGFLYTLLTKGEPPLKILVSLMVVRTELAVRIFRPQKTPLSPT
jgi:hypothetical protein